jgi:ribosomal protein L16/L10AE
MAQRSKTKEQQNGNGTSNGTQKVDGERVASIEKAQKLIALARSESKGGNIDAARTAALKAIELMGDSEVVMLPLDVFEEGKRRIEGALKKAKDEKIQNMLIGAAIGKFLLGNVRL